MKYNPTFQFFIYVVACWLFAACNMDYFDKDRFAIESYPANYALPILKGTLNIEDIVTTDSMNRSDILDQDGMMVLRVADTTYLKADDLFSIPNRSNSLEYIFDEGMIFDFENTGEYMINKECSLGFYQSNTGISEAEIAEGYMEISVSTNLKHGGTITVTAPHYTKNGVPVSSTINIEPSKSTINRRISETVSFSETTLTFPWDAKMIADCEIILNNSGESTNIGDFIKIEIGYKTQIFDIVKGNFNKNYRNKRAQVPFKFMRQLSGNIQFDNPIVNIYSTSTFGAYTGIRIDEIYSEKRGVPEKRRSFGGTPADGIKVIDPAITLSDVKSNNFSFTNENTEFMGGMGGIPSNADPNKALTFAFQNAPDSLVARYTCLINPKDEPFIGFYSKQSTMSIITEVQLPFAGTSQLLLVDTFDYNFLSEKDAQNIEYIVLKLLIENGLPVNSDIAMDVYNENNSNGNLERLFAIKAIDGNIKINSAEIDSDGKVLHPVRRTVEIRLEREQVKMLAQGEKMIVTSTIDTPAGQNIQFEGSNELKLQIALKVKAGLPVDQLN